MKEADGCLMVVSVLLLAAVWFCASSFTSLREEAVKFGHAEYFLDKENNRRWRWLDPCEEVEKQDAKVQ